MRLVDPTIWDKPWYRKLSPAEKCAFKFITDKCDNAGVWAADFEAADFHIGESIDWNSLPGKVNGNIKILENGKWWLIDFVIFQCRRIVTEKNATDNASKSYVADLKRNGIYEEYLRIHLVENVEDPNEGLGRVSGDPQDNDKEKDKDNEKRHRYGLNKHVLLTDANYSELCTRYGKQIADEYIQKVDDYCENHGKTYANYTNAVHTYIRNDERRGVLKLAKPIEKKICPKCGKELLGKGVGVCIGCGWSPSRPGTIK